MKRNSRKLAKIADYPQAHTEDDLDTLVGLCVDRDKPVLIMADGKPVGVVTKDSLLHAIRGEDLNMAQEELLKPFKEFAGQQGDYYAKVFLAIQQARLPRWHVNWAAVICSFAWAKLRGSWLLFWIGFLIDLVVVVQLGTAYRYKQGAGEVQVDIDALKASGKEDLAANKQFLLDRYDNWADNGILTALIILVLGRLLFGWMADRFYFYQYNKWRVDCKAASGFVLSRVIGLCVIMAMIVPLMMYRSTQFAPEARDCVKQSRAVAEGEDISFKDRFDCAIISDFPTLIWLDRPSAVTYPRNDDGSRYMKVEPPRGNANSVNLFNYSSTMIDIGIGYLTAFYGAAFDVVTGLLRNLLSALTAIFVGTPWIITMGALIAMSYVFAGLRTTIFVSASLGYLALFGFWAISMETLSLVAASVIICVVGGLPMGVWVGKSKRGRALLTPVLDIMQTIPSFVYLLPAIAFFRNWQTAGDSGDGDFCYATDGAPCCTGDRACARIYQRGGFGLRRESASVIDKS